MAPVDFTACMEAIGAAAVDAGLIEDGRAYAWPTTEINPPCVIVDYPAGPQPFDNTMARGSDRTTFVAYLAVGGLVPRISGAVLNTYLQPFKDAVEGYAPELPDELPWSTARVTTWEVVPLIVKTLQYQALRFEIDVVT